MENSGDAKCQVDRNRIDKLLGKIAKVANI